MDLENNIDIIEERFGCYEYIHVKTLGLLINQGFVFYREVLN